MMGVLLVVFGLGMEGIRTELKRDQAVELMRTLDRALLAYYQKTGSWPVEVGSPDDQAIRADLSHLEADSAGADRTLELMAGLPASRAVLEALPEVLRVRPEHGVLYTSPWGTIQDPWGRRLHCLTSTSPLPAHRKAVAANQNRPVFISPGPDGRFGFSDVAAASDNIRSDEVGH